MKNDQQNGTLVKRKSYFDILGVKDENELATKMIKVMFSMEGKKRTVIFLGYKYYRSAEKIVFKLEAAKGDEAKEKAYEYELLITAAGFIFFVRDIYAPDEKPKRFEKRGNKQYQYPQSGFYLINDMFIVQNLPQVK